MFEVPRGFPVRRKKFLVRAEKFPFPWARQFARKHLIGLMILEIFGRLERQI
jgi:hypothetical protein